MILALIGCLLLTLTPAPAFCQPDTIWGTDVAWKMDHLRQHHDKPLDPPVIGGLQMPERLWWMAQVAADVTCADPVLLSCVMRFECDFRTEPYRDGALYIPPMGIHRGFRGKYPVDDVFGNILTAARRLAQFESAAAALHGYNKDRSSAFGRYCRAVLGETRRLSKTHGKIRDSAAYRAALDLGKRGLFEMELKAKMVKR